MTEKKLTLSIDKKTVTVNASATILDAASLAGASVPTLCHEQGLHPYGACRICLVEVEGPPRRMAPACTTPAADGMIVHTLSPAVVAARKDILELLLINHPLDCPVCDKAGECRLQDLAHEYGLGPGLFAEQKRTSPADYASPVIERNQNRCILCGKCVRVCRERCAVNALTFSGRGGGSRVGAAFDEALDCEFCGECVEICPVGALATKQFKYKARVWNLETAESACIYCGSGCRLALDASRGSVVRVRSVAGGYLCAKGRFGWDVVNHGSRLTAPKVRVNGKLVDCTWDEAVSVIVTNLKVLKGRYGASCIGGLGSVRTSNEENFLFQKFMRMVVGTNNVDVLARLKLPFGLNALYSAEETATIGSHDLIIVLDKNAVEINPQISIEIARAINKGGSRLILMGNARSKLDALASLSIAEDPAAALVGLSLALRSTRRASAMTRKAAELLSSANGVAIVLPARCTSETFALVKEFAAALLKPVVYYPVFMRGNIQGALDMGALPDYYPGYQKINDAARKAFEAAWGGSLPDGPGLNAVDMLCRTGPNAVSGLYIMGDNPVGSDHDLAAALQRLEFLVVQDIFLTETAELADVVLPAASFLEKSGTMTTGERRLRQLVKAEERRGESLADWEIIQAVARRWGAEWSYASTADIMKEIRSLVPFYRNLVPGRCWKAGESPLAGTITDLSLTTASGIMDREVLTAGRLLFSSGTMTTRSRELAAMARSKAASR